MGDFLLANPALLEPIECFALTYVEMMTLRRADFFDLVEKHGVGCSQLKRHVRVFIRWTAAKRGMICFAKLKQKHWRARGCHKDRINGTGGWHHSPIESEGAMLSSEEVERGDSDGSRLS